MPSFAPFSETLRSLLDGIPLFNQTGAQTQGEVAAVWLCSFGQERKMETISDFGAPSHRPSSLFESRGFSSIENEYGYVHAWCLRRSKM